MDTGDSSTSLAEPMKLDAQGEGVPVGGDILFSSRPAQPDRRESADLLYSRDLANTHLPILPAPFPPQHQGYRKKFEHALYLDTMDFWIRIRNPNTDPGFLKKIIKNVENFNW